MNLPSHFNSYVYICSYFGAPISTLYLDKFVQISRVDTSLLVTDTNASLCDWTWPSVLLSHTDVCPSRYIK